MLFRSRAEKPVDVASSTPIAAAIPALQADMIRVKETDGSLRGLTRDDLAFPSGQASLVNGLSASENYFMEAVYRSGRFPCLFIGGSAGGKFDFQTTQIFDGARTVQNHAVVAFIRVGPGRRYGVFKSQNFKKTGKSFFVA